MPNPDQFSEVIVDELIEPFDFADQLVTDQPELVLIETDLPEWPAVLPPADTVIELVPERPSRKTKRSRRGEGNDSRVSDDLVKVYLTDIGQYPLLTKDDEVRLAKQIEAGAEARQRLEAVNGPVSAKRHAKDRALVAAADAAKKQFVESNLRLVVSVAKKYQSSNMPLLDLIQEGNFGLEHAVVKFDWQKGFKFSTYATWWIRQAIERGIDNKSRVVRLPVHAAEDQARLAKAENRLKNLNLDVTPSALAKNLDWEEGKVFRVLQDRVNTNILSLDEPLNPDDSGSSEIGDMIGDVKSNDGYLQTENEIIVGDILNSLVGRDRQVMVELFGFETGVPSSVNEVATKMGLNNETVRRIRRKSINYLRALHASDLR